MRIRITPYCEWIKQDVRKMFVKGQQDSSFLQSLLHNLIIGRATSPCLTYLPGVKTPFP
jgi:hypothetical protein